MPSISGTVRAEGIPVAGRIVRAYRRDTGVLLASATSSDGIPPPGDEHYQQVSLLLRLDNLLDSSPRPKTITASGNAQISTAHSQYSGSSLSVSGGNDYLSTPSSTEFDFGTQPFTIEMWVRAASFGGVPTILSRRIGAVYTPYELRLDGGGNPVLWLSNAAQNSWALFGTFSGASLSLSTWHHLAITGTGSTLRCFRDGVMSPTTHAYNGMATGSTPLYLGRGGDGSFVGNIADLRITKGVARYTANFAPPTAAFPAAAVLPATPIGSYSIDTPYSGEVQVVCLDDAAGTVYNDQILRTTPV